MTSFLVVYGTGEGQTAKVAGRIATALTERGHDVTVAKAREDLDVDVGRFDAVLVGSPVNNRRHLPDVVSFVEANREELSSRPSAFFQLSFASIVSSRWAQDGAGEFVDDLVERTGWHPDRVGLFAGAVAYTRYDRLTRLFFRLVSSVTTGDTDTSRDYEYTDWDDVEAFAAEFAAFAADRLAATGGDRAEAGDGDDARPSSGRVARTALAVGSVLAVLVAVYWLVVRGDRPEVTDASRHVEDAVQPY